MAPRDIKHKTARQSRSGFTLIELMLSLALIVVATSLIGSIIHMFAKDFSNRTDDVRRQQLAVALLHMIAEDVRSVVQEQEYDPSVLEQMLGGGQSTAGTGQGEPADDGTGLASASLDSTSSSDTDLTENVSTQRPMGIYGDQFTLLVDVSIVPRVDQYQGEMVNSLSTGLTDIPGDLKSVTYFVQTATNAGVSDDMSVFSLENATEAYASGLVRRELDRLVTAYAEEIGDVDRLSRTGSLVAPEVVSVEFAYYDGTEWLIEWDSEEQGLPWLVQIQVAMQTASAGEVSELQPGVPISQMSRSDRQTYGIEVYELTVAIPGAQLQAADAASADTAAGLDSLGL